MPDKEHPAAKAGRYFGAAKVAVSREKERRAAAIAARPVAVPAAPPPPPPPPARTDDLFGKAVFVWSVAALVSLAFVLVHVYDVIPGSGKTISCLVAGVFMLVEAGLLTSNWNDANARLGQRLLTRVWGFRGAGNRRERFAAGLVRNVLTLVGIAFLGGALWAFLAPFVSP